MATESGLQVVLLQSSIRARGCALIPPPTPSANRYLGLCFPRPRRPAQPHSTLPSGWTSHSAPPAALRPSFPHVSSVSQKSTQGGDGTPRAPPRPWHTPVPPSWSGPGPPSRIPRLFLSPSGEAGLSRSKTTARLERSAPRGNYRELQAILPLES